MSEFSFFTLDYPLFFHYYLHIHPCVYLLYDVTAFSLRSEACFFMNHFTPCYFPLSSLFSLSYIHCKPVFALLQIEDVSELVLFHVLLLLWSKRLELNMNVLRTESQILYVQMMSIFL